jgi:hypothetical protein
LAANCIAMSTADSKGQAGALSLAVHEFFVSLLHAERRIDPFFRPAFDKLLREPLTALVQGLIQLQRREVDEALGQETPLPGEAEFVDAIAAEMNAYLRSHYRPGGFERGGNTKTHGIVRAKLVVHEDIATECRHGVFAERRGYPAWVRFAGPGPASPPDIEDVGVLSIGVKLMDVPGPKLSMTSAGRRTSPASAPRSSRPPMFAPMRPCKPWFAWAHHCTISSTDACWMD